MSNSNVKRRTKIRFFWMAPAILAMTTMQSVADDGSDEQPENQQPPTPQVLAPPQTEFFHSQEPNIIMLPPPALPRNHSMDRMRDEFLPMSPAEIQQMRRMLNERERAMLDRPAPTIENRTASVSLEPGAPTQTIRVSPSYVSTLVFVDSHGNPWPIIGTPAIGAPNLYSVIVHDGDNRNVITISPLAEGGSTNMAIVLSNQTVPLTLNLRTEQTIVDARVDLRVDGVGPRTDLRALPQPNLPRQTASNAMMRFLDHVPPDGAVELMVDGPMRVWEYNREFFIRTNRSIISPAPDGVVNGTGNVRVFRFAHRINVLMYSDGGEVRFATVGNRHLLND